MTSKYFSECHKLILEFFKGDEKKAIEWFKTPNPLLGSVPMTMIQIGAGDRLLVWIQFQTAQKETPHGFLATQ
jgi:hypothetical protein